MTLAELQVLVAGGETLTVEFKSDKRRLADGELVDAVAAMANAQGGTLLEGVEDDGTITGLHPAHADFGGVVPLVENRDRVVVKNGRGRWTYYSLPPAGGPGCS